MGLSMGKGKDIIIRIYIFYTLLNSMLHKYFASPHISNVYIMGILYPIVDSVAIVI